MGTHSIIGLGFVGRFILRCLESIIFSTFTCILALFISNTQLGCNRFLTSVRTALGDSFSSELESLHQENIGLIQVLFHYSGLVHLQNVQPQKVRERNVRDTKSGDERSGMFNVRWRYGVTKHLTGIFWYQTSKIFLTFCWCTILDVCIRTERLRTVFLFSAFLNL